MKPNPIIFQLFSQATHAHQNGQLDQAGTLYQQVINQAPNHADAHHLLGLVYGQQGDYARAVKHLRRAVAIDDANPIFHNNLGEAWRRQDRLKQAIKSYQRALILAPNFAEAHYNLANVFKTQERAPEAIHHYQEAIRLKPTYFSAYHNLGNTYLEHGRYRSAMKCYQRCVEINPDFAEAHNNLGITLREWDRIEEAIASYRRATQLKPDFVEARRNLAFALEKQGNLDEARQAYQTLLKLEPENQALRLHLDTLCPIIPADNAEIDDTRHQIDAALDRYAPHLPFDVEAGDLGVEPPSILTYHGRNDLPFKQKWAALVAGNFTPRTPKISRGKPHLGFVVTAGHEGVFLKCMRGLINNFPVERFKITVVCGAPIGEQVIGPAITNPAVRLLPLRGKFNEMVEKVAQARFDILHYWEVGTDATNYFLPFCRPAPIQCATWGWPTTSGIPQIDYFVSCELLETDESDSHYSEQLVRLPHLPTYYYRPPVPEVKPSRADFGLSDAQHLYLCQQNLRKVQPDFDPLIAEILRRDSSGLVLLIEDKQPTITNLLRQRLRQTMPDVIERVRFLPRLPEAEYLSLLTVTNVILDTLHYTGGANTTYDAFAAGAPIVTLPGRFHRGRFTTAAYQQIGVTDCTADTPDAYVEIALALATDRAYRAEISAKISKACPALFEDKQAVTELADFFEGTLAEKRLN